MKNTSKLISFLFLSFSVLLLLYVFYRSEFFHQGNKFDYYSKYYLISAVFIILSVITFFIRKKIKIKILVLLISTVFGLYLVESYLAISDFINYKKKIIQEEIKKSDIQYDTRTKFQIYKDLKKENPNIVVKITPEKFINETNQKILPFSGISNRKTIFCNNTGYYSIFQSDRYGFNNLDDEWDKKHIEFLLVGGNYAHGGCVNEANNIGGNLRRNLVEGCLLNLGQEDTGPLIVFATLKEYLPLTNSKRVLWIYQEEEDLGYLNLELKNKILLKYLNDPNFTQNLYLKQDELDTKLYKKLFEMQKYEQQMLKQQIELSILSKFLKFYYLRTMIEKLFNPSFHHYSEFKQIIKLTKKFIEENGAKFYFVILPHHSRYLNNFINDENDQNYHIVQFIDDLKIPKIDIYEELTRIHGDSLSLFKFQSYDRNLYKLVSKIILKKISEFENIKE